MTLSNTGFVTILSTEQTATLRRLFFTMTWMGLEDGVTSAAKVETWEMTTFRSGKPEAYLLDPETGIYMFTSSGIPADAEVDVQQAWVAAFERC